jgi:hypothetical protein
MPNVGLPESQVRSQMATDSIFTRSEPVAAVGEEEALALGRLNVRAALIEGRSQ